MNFIFVGSVYPKYLLDYLVRSKIGADFAANNYQTALLDGFKSYYNPIKIISGPSINNLRQCESFYLKGKVVPFEESGYNNFYYVGNIRNRIFKMPFRFFKTRRVLLRLLHSDINENLVCCYSLHSPFLLAILSLRKKIRKVCVVIPDLPQYMSDNNSLFYKMAKAIDGVIINYCIRKFDSFAILTTAMTTRLPLDGKQWVLIEGIYHDRKYPIVEKSMKNVILYTGQLQKRYGIFDLVDAFMKISDPNYELWLCGMGNDEEMQWLNEQVNRDGRIKLMGRVAPDHVLALQRQATLLVNPRHSNEEFTKYSFPSKTMEYLASGTPTLMCKLPSIPLEYYNHLFFFDDESVDGMSQKIVEICSLDKEFLKIKGESAAEFIKSYKNSSYQVKKIISMLMS